MQVHWVEVEMIGDAVNPDQRRCFGFHLIVSTVHFFTLTNVEYYLETRVFGARKSRSVRHNTIFHWTFISTRSNGIVCSLISSPSHRIPICLSCIRMTCTYWLTLLSFHFNNRYCCQTRWEHVIFNNFSLLHSAAASKVGRVGQIVTQFISISGDDNAEVVIFNNETRLHAFFLELTCQQVRERSRTVIVSRGLLKVYRK